jgi:hypothetical protein
MKNITPSGYQGFPSLFNGLFGGTAMIFRKLFRRSAAGRGAEAERRREDDGLQPIRSSWSDGESRPSEHPEGESSK